MGFEFVASGDVDGSWNEFLDLGDYSCVVEQVHGSFFVEVEKQIDVAVRAFGAARCGAKQGEVFDAEFLKTRRGSAENVKNGGKLLRASCCGRRGCVAEDGAAWDEGDAGRLKSRPNGCEIGRYWFAFRALKVSDGQPGDVRLTSQVSLTDAEECSASAAHFRCKGWVWVMVHVR